MNVRAILLHLSLISGVGPALIKKILKQVGIENTSSLYNFSVQDLVTRCSLSLAQAQLVYDGLRDTQSLDKEQQLLERHGYKFVTILDEDYPSLLAEIYVPPAVLYYQGSVLADTPCLAVVGSRQGTAYGQRVVTMLVQPLVDHGWTIVSGGALGIDAMAHQATLQSSGKTIAVLGSGLLHPYPLSNKKLFESIVDSGGTIVTPFPLSMKAMPGNFPARNRIIAGLSSGCVVVQAAQTSGASITAMFALEQGREVFAVPGPIDDPLSEGCHYLLKQGARLVTTVEDILQEFGQQLPAGSGTVKEVVEQKVDINQLKTLHEKILFLCAQPVSLDQLVQVLSDKVSIIQEALVDLQLDGKVDQNNHGLWIISR